MTARFAYDEDVDPPAPVIPVRISRPIGEDAVLLPMLVDTGADCTLVPARVVRRLGLPQVDAITVIGVGGARRRSTMHAATLALGERRFVARVVAFPDEAVLGRDVLNQTVVTLDGPSLKVAVESRARKKRSKRST